MLKTVNLTQVNIDVLVVEMDGSNPEKDEDVRNLLLANGFELDISMKGTKAGLRNEWFVSRSFSPPKVCFLCRLMCACSHDKSFITCLLEAWRTPWSCLY